MAETGLTYEQLFDTLRREKSRDELQKLDERFFEQVRDFLARKYDIIRAENAKGLGSLATQRANIEYQNVRKILKELYDRRERKILTLAMHRTRTDAAIIDMSALLPEERAFFDRIIDLMLHTRTQALAFSEVRTPWMPSTEPSGDGDEGDAHFTTSDDGAGQVQEERGEGAVSTLDTQIVVRFLSHVPKFVGKNLQIFGPYEEGDSATLPEDIGQILIKKGRAEELESD